MGDNLSKPGTLQELQLQVLTGMSEDDLKGWYLNFRTECPSGELTKDEFEKLYVKLFPSGKASNFTKHVFRTFDTDKSGTVNFAEFMVGISTMRTGTVQQKLAWAFNLYDLDNNGHLSRYEVVEILKAYYKMSDKKHKRDAEKDANEKADDLFQKLDTNQDNQISNEEFVNGAAGDSSILEIFDNVRQSKVMKMA